MIELQNIQFYYKKGVPVLENLSLRLEGGIYGLLGENGVGKTTLFHLIAGMLFPKDGSCKVVGYDTQRRLPDMYRHLFFLPESLPMPKDSIYSFAKRHAVFYPDFSREELDAHLEAFGMDGNRPLSDYSFGQQKCIMLAYVLALHTEITLLDEPTVGLSLTNKSIFVKLIAQTYEEDRCLLISSHNPQDLINLLDHVIIMDGNQVIFNQPVEAISQKLFFLNSDRKQEDALYIQQAVHGYDMVLPNPLGQESLVDVQLLYQTVLTHKHQINHLFNTDPNEKSL